MGGVCSNPAKGETKEEEEDEEDGFVKIGNGVVVEEKIIIMEEEKEVIYLNHAMQCRLSPAVQAAGMAALQRQPWEMAAATSLDEQAVRTLFAQLIHAEKGASEIAIMPSTAFAITLAAHNIARLALKKPPQHRNNNNNNRTRPGKILLLQDQYPSAVYPWQEICDKKHKHAVTLTSPTKTAANKSRVAAAVSSSQQQDNGSNSATTTTTTTTTTDDATSSSWSLYVVPYPEEEYTNVTRTWTDSILEHLNRASNQDIRVLVLPPLHWADGRVIDLVKIGAICQKRNLYLIVDATQAAGIFEINVQQIKPSLLACSAHKWLRGGSSGTSLVYIDSALHTAWKPLDQHERGRRIPGDANINAATRQFMNPSTGYPELFYRDARKFDAGGKANPLLLPMLHASLKQIVGGGGGEYNDKEKVDPNEAQKRLQELMQPLLDWCRAKGFVLPTSPHAFHLIGIRPPPSLNLVPEQLVAICQYLETSPQYRIILTAKSGCLRISPYIHDTQPCHIQTLIDALDNVFFGDAATVTWKQQKQQQQKQQQQQQQQGNNNSDKQQRQSVLLGEGIEMEEESLFDGSEQQDDATESSDFVDNIIPCEDSTTTISTTEMDGWKAVKQKSRHPN